GDVVADAHVLDQEVREMALVEPVRLPVVDVPHAHGFGMYLLPHALELLRGERDRQVGGALADPRRAAHRPRAVALEGRALVGVDGRDLEVLADQLMVVLRVRDGGLEQLRPVLRRRAGREGKDRARLGDVLATDVIADEAGLAGRVPLHTLRADIDYGFYEARTT